MDPLKQALHVAGAVPAEPYTFRTLAADYKMERLLVGPQFQVWAPPDRMEHIPGQHDWRLGARSGKDADGSLAQMGR